MGGDGGCINSRCDLVKTRGHDFLNRRMHTALGRQHSCVVAFAQETLGKQEAKRMRMTTCSLTNEPLEVKMGVMADRMGNLFSKEHVIARLLSKQIPQSFAHVQKLKDLRTLKDLSGRSSGSVSSTKKNPQEKAAVAGDIIQTTGNTRNGSGKMFCPLSGKELDDGVTRSVLLWNCGCVCSWNAFEQMAGKNASKCPMCGDDITEKVTLAPDEAEAKQLFEKLPEKVRNKIKAMELRSKAEEKGELQPSPRDEDEDHDRAAKRRKKDPQHRGDHGAPEGKEPEVLNGKNKKSDVFNALFRPSAEINARLKNHRDGFGIGAGARRV
ncbi:unnamed protein product [Amoebophrya sp. A120]|nr:unnamed protein product [Amoebophrya sp. A120]|eukprot:GSA120T00019041001.1